MHRSDDEVFGLVFRKGESRWNTREIQVPLQSVSVDLSVKGFVADVTSTLTYKHEEPEAVEAAFVFPMDEQSAVYHFQAEIDGRVIVGECQTKEEAQETYDTAVESGHTAFLMNEEKTSDVFRIIIGNLPPKMDTVIKFSYVIELNMEVDDSVKFVLPTVLNPRYGNPEKSKESPDAVGVSKPYSFTMQGAVSAAAGNKIVKITSDTHGINTEINSQDNASTAKVSLSGAEKFEADLRLNIFYEQVHQPQAIYEAGGADAGGFMKQDVVMLNFFPQTPDCSTSCGEYIFVVDRSGSMQGDKISSAKETLLLFLKSLPVGCYFNVVSFGSSFESLFKQGSVIYNERNLKTACSLQKKMEANFGGTEIYRPLEDIYQSKRIDGHPRQIFLLTDGEVWDTNNIIKLVKKNAQHTRVFTFGIGSGASTALVKGVARAGRGMYEFVADSEKLHGKVMNILKQARQDFTSDVALDWTLPDGNTVVAIPREIPPIFSGQNLIMYGLLKEPMPVGAKGNVKLTWKVGEKPMSHDLDVVSTAAHGGTSLHRLAAKKKIQELQSDSGDDEIRTKESIVLLSTSANIVSNHTSFVAVDKESKVKVKHSKPKEDEMMDCALYDAAPGMNLKCYSLCDSSGPVLKSASLYSGGEPLGSRIAKNVRKLFSGGSKKQKKMAPAMRRAAPRKPMSMAVSDSLGADSFAPLGSDSDDAEEYDDLESEKGAGAPSLMGIIELQAFDGHWELSKKVVSILGKEEKVLKSAAPLKDLSVWATALVMACLEMKWSAQKDEWEMIHDKALSWLRGQGQALEGQDPTDVIEAARKALQ